MEHNLENASIDTPLFTIKGEYTCKCVKVYDGDTVHVVFKIFEQLYRFKIRLLGINTPELRGVDRERGIESRDYLRNRILNKTLCIKCGGFDKYGRLLGELLLDGVNINQELIVKGLAVAY